MSVALVPELRFPEFVDDWEAKIVDNIAQKIGSGVTPKGGKQSYLDEGIPLIRSQNVNRDTVILDDVAFISEATHAAMSNSHVEDGDILLNITGASIGRSALVSTGISPANVNQHVCIIRLRQNDNAAFLQRLISAWQGQREIFRTQAGGGREGLNFEAIKAFKFSFPSLPEQKKIAAFLSAVDAKLAAVEAQLTGWRDFKRGMMQALFSQTLRFKADDGSDFPDWENKKLEEIAKFIGGGTPSKNVDAYWKGNLPWISSSDIEEQHILRVSITRHISEAGAKSSATKLIPKGSLLMVTRVGVGKVAIAPIDLYASQDFTALLDLQANNVFLAYQFLARPRDLNGLEQGSTIKGIPLEVLRTFDVLLPSLAEQQKIADALSAIDSKIEALTTRLDATREFKRGLLQKMFV